MKQKLWQYLLFKKLLLYTHIQVFNLILIDNIVKWWWLWTSIVTIVSNKDTYWMVYKKKVNYFSINKQKIGSVQISGMK